MDAPATRPADAPTTASGDGKGYCAWSPSVVRAPRRIRPGLRGHCAWPTVPGAAARRPDLGPGRRRDTGPVRPGQAGLYRSRKSRPGGGMAQARGRATASTAGRRAVGGARAGPAQAVAGLRSCCSRSVAVAVVAAVVAVVTLRLLNQAPGAGRRELVAGRRAGRRPRLPPGRRGAHRRRREHRGRGGRAPRRSAWSRSAAAVAIAVPRLRPHGTEAAARPGRGSPRSRRGRGRSRGRAARRRGPPRAAAQPAPSAAAGPGVLVVVGRRCVGLLVLDGLTDVVAGVVAATNPLGRRRGRCGATPSTPRASGTASAWWPPPSSPSPLLADRWREQRPRRRRPAAGLAARRARWPAPSPSFPTLWAGVADTLPAARRRRAAAAHGDRAAARGRRGDRDGAGRTLGARLRCRTGLLEWTLLAAGHRAPLHGRGRRARPHGRRHRPDLVPRRRHRRSSRVLLEPARRRVRGHADRLVYGSRDNALSLVRQVLGHVSSAERRRRAAAGARHQPRPGDAPRRRRHRRRPPRRLGPGRHVRRRPGHARSGPPARAAARVPRRGRRPPHRRLVRRPPRCGPATWRPSTSWPRRSPSP